MRFLPVVCSALILSCAVAGEDELPIDDGAADSPDSPCAGITPAAASEGAHAFMASHGMIHDGDESKMDGFSVHWQAKRAVASQGKCLLVMNLAITSFGTVSDGDVYEVIAARKTSAGLELDRYEDVRTVPASIRVGIGTYMRESGRLPAEFYYVELHGDSALTAAKTLAAGLAPKVCVLAANMSAKNVHREGTKLIGEADGKLAWDPTPARRWKLKDATFLFRRGNTVEIQDGRPSQLDESFESYFSASLGQVGPWSFCAIRRVANADGSWRNLP